MVGEKLGPPAGAFETLGLKDGCPLGILDREGFIDGSVLGSDDGCVVGKSDTDGFSEGWLLGAVLIEGDSEGMDVG